MHVTHFVPPTKPKIRPFIMISKSNLNPSMRHTRNSMWRHGNHPTLKGAAPMRTCWITPQVFTCQHLLNWLIPVWRLDPTSSRIKCTSSQPFLFLFPCTCSDQRFAFTARAVSRVARYRDTCKSCVELCATGRLVLCDCTSC